MHKITSSPRLGRARAPHWVFSISEAAKGVVEGFILKRGRQWQYKPPSPVRPEIRIGVGALVNDCSLRHLSTFE